MNRNNKNLLLAVSIWLVILYSLLFGIIISTWAISGELLPLMGIIFEFLLLTTGGILFGMLMYYGGD
jgi:ABC-type transport system involved in multi-copper enzyme maturation permease subunit